MSNSLPMLLRLSKLCRSDHSHQKLEGASRSQNAAIYPLPLLKTILGGMADTDGCKDSVSNMATSEYDVSLCMSISPVQCAAADAASPSLKPGALPVHGGGTVQVNYAIRDFKAAYVDEYTREVLPHALVQEAIREELEYFNPHVWELADAKHIMQDSDAKLIKTRWVICNNGDVNCPDIRARLVATEINTYKPDDFFRIHASFKGQEAPFLRHGEPPQA